MSKKIIGVTVGTQLPKPNLQQMDPTKGDYVLNKPIGLEGQVVGFDIDGNMVAQDNILIDAELTQSNKAADAKATGDRLASLDTQFSNLSDLVGDTSVSEQINDAISNNVKQTDWNQTDESAIDFILNKPDPMTDEEIDAICGATIKIEGVAPENFLLTDASSNEIYKLYVENGNLVMMKEAQS